MQTNAKKLGRCLPVGNLPYDTDSAATKMMVKLFEDLPFLANMPLASKDDSILNRTLFNLTGIKHNSKKILFDEEALNLKSYLIALDAIFNDPNPQNLETYKFNTYFLKKYLQIIEKIKPRETVVNLIGPFSLALSILKNDGSAFITDKFYRKYIIQALAARALWIIQKIKEASADTRPIIIFEEPLLYKIGETIRNSEEVKRDTIVNLLAKVTQKIQTTGALVGIQSFEKCDWKIPIEAGINIISFDAYNNPNNLHIMTEQINEFLANGGRINWGIVPVQNESLVKDSSVDKIFDRLIKTFEGLVSAGASQKLIYNHAMVSINGNVDNLPIIFAEKALIMATQLAKKIPVKS